MGSKKRSTKKAEQAEYVESLKVAFETTMNGQIESSVELLTRPKQRGAVDATKEGDEEIISRSENVVAKIGAHVKTVLTIMGSKKSSTKKAEQAE